jgi:hypothetical protein
MARGNERDEARAKNLKKAAAAAKGGANSAPKVGGVNANAEALAAKVAAKKKAKEDAAASGVEATELDRGSCYSAKEKIVNTVNPHTGKKDAKFNAKLAAAKAAVGGPVAKTKPKKKKGTSVAGSGVPPELAAAMAAAGKKKKKKPAAGAMATAQGAAKAKVGK